MGSVSRTAKAGTMSTRASPNEEKVDLRAFVSHTSKSLKDSTVFLASVDNKQVQYTDSRNGTLMLARRDLGGFRGKTAEEVLRGFCQEISLPFQTTKEAAGIVCGIAQQLFRAFDGNATFARDQLPLGLQGLQQVDWTKQNSELAALRQRHKERTVRNIAFRSSPYTAFCIDCIDTLEGDEYLCTGVEDTDLVLIDETLEAANIMKYRIHNFHDGVGPQSRYSWQAFVKTDHPDFAGGCLQNSLCPIQDLGSFLMLAMKVFLEAKAFLENPAECGEMAELKEMIWRNEFYEKSTVIEDHKETAAAATTPNPSDQNLAGGEGSTSATRPIQAQITSSHSRSSSSQSTTDTSSSAPDTMEAPQVESVTATLGLCLSKQAKKNRRQNQRKKEKRRAIKAAEQGQLAPNDNVESSAENDADRLTNDSPTAGVHHGTVVPFDPGSAAVDHPRTETTSNTALEDDTTKLAQEMTTVKLFDPATDPSSSTTPSLSEPQSRLEKGKGKEVIAEDRSFPASKVTNTSTGALTPTIVPAIPGQPSSRKQKKQSKKRAAASAPTDSSQEITDDSSRKPVIGETSKLCAGISSSGKAAHPLSISTSAGQPLMNNFTVTPSSSGKAAHPLSISTSAGQPLMNNFTVIPSSSGNQRKKQSEAEQKSKQKDKEVAKNAETSNDARTRIPLSVTNPPPVGFKFDSFHPNLKCLKPDCRAMTSCWDHAVVICPACGTDSFTRYCKKAHLFEDMQRHWLEDCGKNKIVGPIDRTTIRAYQIPMRPYVRPLGLSPNMLERHRQAVSRAMGPGDYSIFADLDEIDLNVAEPTTAEWNAVRGTGKLVLQLKFWDNGTRGCEAHQFNQHMDRILAVGKPVAGDSCMVALGMIRAALVRSGTWREEVLTYLCMQLPGEWGYFKVPESYYNVAEVNARWSINGVLPSF